MSSALQIITNLIIPLGAGMLFLFYGMIFAYLRSHPSKEIQGAQIKVRDNFSRHFIWYLFSFAIFMLARPLQMLLGPHPSPLIIASLRFFLLNGFIAPLIYVMSREFTGQGLSARQKKIAFLLGGSSALIYALAMSLGTTGSEVIFFFGNWEAHDGITPALMGPWYGREWSQLAQCFPMAIFGGLGARYCLKKSDEQHLPKHVKRQLEIFGNGVALFTLCLFIGSVTKMWWLYYIVAGPAAFLMGQAVLEEILELKRRNEQVLPLLKDELFSIISSMDYQPKRLKKTLDLLKMDKDPNAIWIIQRLDSELEQEERVDLHSSMEKALSRALQKHFPHKDPLILPMSSASFAVLVSNPIPIEMSPESSTDPNPCSNPNTNNSNADSNDPDVLPIFLEEIERDSSQQVHLGLGSPKSLESLQESYFEASHALKSCWTSQQKFWIYENSQQTNSPSSYPILEKQAFLNALKLGQGQQCLTHLKILMERLCHSSSHQSSSKISSSNTSPPQQTRARFLELMGAITSQAVDLGQNSEQLLNESERIQSQLLRSKSSKEMQEALICFTQLALPKEDSNQERDGTHTVNMAKDYISKNYHKNISREDVAQSVSVSVSHLTRLFREEGSETIQRCIQNERILKAKELLVHSGNSITSIAYDCGFKDSNYFSTVFKKDVGQTPKQFREC